LLGGMRPGGHLATEPAVDVPDDVPRPPERPIVANAFEYGDRVSSERYQRLRVSLRIGKELDGCELDPRAQVDAAVVRAARCLDGCGQGLLPAVDLSAGAMSEAELAKEFAPELVFRGKQRGRARKQVHGRVNVRALPGANAGGA